MPNSKSFYITTPIYYVNGLPHIGHAYTTILCDAMSRLKRLEGYDVKFITGTDEHGQKVNEAAKKQNISPEKFAEKISNYFLDLVNGGDNLLGVSNDDFVRTTEKRHKKSAQALWKRIQDNGHIYKGKYAGWYSIRDEAYYQESEITEKDGTKFAPTGAEVKWIEEESYFFDLSKWQKKLLEFYEQNPDFIVPSARYNEVVNFVKGGKELVEGSLRDLSISRTTFDWGVPVEGDDKHVMYVWIDALANYLTVLGFPNLESEQYKKFWESPNQSPVHVLGKDILRFHAVYWPAFLMAADLPLPKKLIAHGWWTVEGEKMSKSVGNVIEPSKMIEEFGLDQVRYFLLREGSFGSDGNFSSTSMINRINSDLANNIGNLAQRTLSMVQKECQGKVPEHDLQAEDKELLDLIRITQENKKDHEEKVSNFRFDLLASDIMSFASAANEYIDKQAPWKLKKEDPERMQTVLYTLAESIRRIAIMLQPFMPESMAKMLKQVGYSDAKVKDGIKFEELKEEFALKAGETLPKPEGIFPRVS